MPPAKASTYENMLNYYNRGVFPYVTCECGKIIAENKLKSHQTSNLHFQLLRYKEQHERLSAPSATTSPDKVETSPPPIPVVSHERE